MDQSSQVGGGDGCGKWDGWWSEWDEEGGSVCGLGETVIAVWVGKGVFGLGGTVLSLIFVDIRVRKCKLI